jgi:small subunit ribosomal protein S1
VVAAEYQDHFGEHAYDEQGNYIGPVYEEAVAEADADADAAATGEAPAIPATAADEPPAGADAAPAAVGTDNEGDGA